MAQNKKQLQVATITACILIAAVIVYITTESFSTAIGNALAFILGIIILWSLFAKSERNLKRYQDQIFTQYECMQQLNALLCPRVPFPATRGHRGSPDFLLTIYQHIITEQPKLIVEASSGLSTLTCGYALQQLGAGKVVSLEHEKIYADISNSNVLRHSLEDVASVIHAPLVKHDIGEQQWLWYDISSVDAIAQIDMIIVDGPPRRTQKHARYPALPLLFERLKPGGLVLLDDGNRSSETQIAKMWQKDFSSLDIKFIPLEKGMYIGRKPEHQQAQ